MPVLMHFDKTKSDPLRDTLNELLNTGIHARRKHWAGKALEWILILPVVIVLFLIVILLTGWFPDDLPNWNRQVFTDPTANKRSDALRQAAKEGRTDLIGFCVFFLADINPIVRAAADHALLELLPHIQAADWEGFTLAEREALVKDIDRTWPLRASAILKALEQVGDESALPHVEAFAARLKKETGRTVRELTVASTACLVALRQRQEQAQQAQTLLRASQPSESSSIKTLLRPAKGMQTVEPEELLRATHQSIEGNLTTQLTQTNNSLL